MAVKNTCSAFLKECMADALIQLLREKPLDKITAQQITDLAGVGRATFFRSCSSKEDLITFKLAVLWERWAEAEKLDSRHHYRIGDALSFFRFNYSIRDMYGVLRQAGLQAAIYEAFYQVIAPRYGVDSFECYTNRFYSYGLFGMLDEWYKRGYAETPEQITDIFHRAVAASSQTE